VWAGDPDIPEGGNEASSDRQGLRRSIVSMSILSWFIREINDGAFSIFHLISIQTLLFIAAGLAFLFLRRSIRHWYVWHLRFMLYS
jgi:hypothetical protein